MTKRQALISFVFGAVLVEVIALAALAVLGADSETVAAAYVLLLCAAGLGVGEIVTRYR
jgi:hypothetical protein